MEKGIVKITPTNNHQGEKSRQKILYVNSIKKTVQTLAYVRKEYNCL